MALNRLRGRGGAPTSTDTLPPTDLDSTVMNALPLGVGRMESASLSRPLSLPGVSLEGGIYGLIIIVSLFLRFWQIADMPLASHEIRTAVAALNLTRGGNLPSDAGALLGYGTTVILALAGATDVSVRFLPALVGGLTPLAMIWGRRLIGRGPAVIAAGTMALSPILLDQSRTIGPGAIAAAVSLGLVLSVLEYVRARRPNGLYAVAIFAALALTAGAPAYSAIVALVMFGLVSARDIARTRALPGETTTLIAAIAPLNGHAAGSAKRVPLPTSPTLAASSALSGPDHVMRNRRQEVLLAFSLFAGTFFIVATGALTNLNMVNDGVFAPLAVWLSAVSTGTEPAPVWVGVLTFLVYEPYVAFFGFAGAIAAYRRRRLVDRIFAWWFIVATAMAIGVPDRSASMLATAIVPGAVLAAMLLHQIIVRVFPQYASVAAMATLVLSWGFSLIILGWGHIAMFDPIGVRFIGPRLDSVVGAGNGISAATWLIGILPVIVALLGFLFLWRWTPQAGRSGIGFAASVILIACSIHAGWNLSYQGVGSFGELPHRQQTSPDVRNLASDVDEIRQVLLIGRKEQGLTIDESLRDPMAWYILTQPTRYESRPGGNPAMLLLTVDEKAPTGRFSGRRFALRASAAPRFNSMSEFWRWLIYREQFFEIARTDAVLYVRTQ